MSKLILFCIINLIATVYSECNFPPNKTIELPKDLQFQTNAVIDYFYFTGRIVNVDHFDYHFTVGFERKLTQWLFVGFLNDNTQMYINKTYYFQSSELQFKPPFNLLFESKNNLFQFSTMDLCCTKGNLFNLIWITENVSLNLNLELMDNSFLYGDSGFLRYSTTSNCDFGAYVALPHFQIKSNSFLVFQDTKIKYNVDFGNMYFEKQFITVVDPALAFQLFTWVYFTIEQTKYGLTCPFYFDQYAELCVLTKLENSKYSVEQVTKINYLSNDKNTTPSIFVQTDQNFSFLIYPQSPKLKVLNGFFDGLAFVEIVSSNMNQTKLISMAFLEYHNFPIHI